MYVYKTTCLVNNKIYIGQTVRTNLKSYLGSGGYFKKALKKHGKENFKKEILKVCETQKQLDQFEKYYILRFKSYNSDIGYNLLIGSSSSSNKNFTEESKNKIRLKALGRKATKETKEKMSKQRLGKKLSAYHVARILEGRKNYVMTDKTKEKISKTLTGKPLTESRKESIRKTTQTSEHSKKLKKAWKLRRLKMVIDPTYGKPKIKKTLTKEQSLKMNKIKVQTGKTGKGEKRSAEARINMSKARQAYFLKLKQAC